MILKAGGLVEPYTDAYGESIGPERIWIPNSEPPVPGLAMTRSIGDKLAASIGLIAEPEIDCFRITADDKFIIIGSDGLFEFLTNDFIIHTVASFWKKG